MKPNPSNQSQLNLHLAGGMVKTATDTMGPYIAILPHLSLEHLVGGCILHFAFCLYYKNI